jgi:hypothetical protein
MYYLLFRDFPYDGADIKSIYEKVSTEELDMTSKFYFKLEPYWKNAS